MLEIYEYSVTGYKNIALSSIFCVILMNSYLILTSYGLTTIALGVGLILGIMTLVGMLAGNKQGSRTAYSIISILWIIKSSYVLA